MSSESFGTTSLSQSLNIYGLLGSGWSATLTYGGVNVTTGQFGAAWEPWSAERRTGTVPNTIEVVWKNTATNQFLVWTVDLNGEYMSQGPIMSGTSYALESIESSFSHDLNGDGTTGVVSTPIESTGSIKLVQQGDQYAVMPTAGSTGPVLKYAGAAATTSTFAGWKAVAAAQNATGYEVAWQKTGSNEFVVWQTDSNGHYLWDAVKQGSGNTIAFQAQEIVFGQDLNGDGTTGVRTQNLETAGATTLAQVGDGYSLYDHGTTVGPQLSRGGDLVTVGQYPGWQPIAVEKTTTGYEIAWQSGDQYIVWATDADGNYVSDLTGPSPVSGASNILKAFEVSFGADLNGVGGVAAPGLIDTVGTTALVNAQGYFFLGQLTGSTGPALRFGGSLVTAGQFGGWSPIGAEKTATGYEVVWKLGADQYTVWTTDQNGNWLSQSPIVSGSSSIILSREATFSQDLNSDGTTTITPVDIEAQGAVSLTKAGNAYFLYDVGTTTGPQLKFGGAAYAEGQFGAWAPIAVEKTTGGYQVAWKMGTADQFVVWQTDASGNWLSQTAVMSGASNALKAFEPAFGQDLNADATTATPVTIEAQGSTSLVQVADNFFLNTSGGTWGPELSRGGMPVAAGQYGAWSPIGAEKTTSGYMVAWKNADTGQYIVWSTDNAGNYLSDVTGPVAGSSNALAALEPVFSHDLNGAGGVTSTSVLEASGNTTLNQVLDRYFVQSTGAEWGAELSMGGAAVTAGQFGPWAPIQAEKTSAGYLVAWKNASTGEYIFWTTDNGGNYQSASAVLGPTSSGVGPYEAIFNYDFDGLGGVAFFGPTESAGSTSLGGIGANILLKPTGSAGVLLKFGGTAVLQNQFAGWNAVAGEQTATGYQVAWNQAGTGNYVIWQTDSNANFVSISSVMSGNSLAFQAAETSFSQDINGDGRIGLPTGTIESSGATSLYGANASYYLGGAAGPQLKFGGATVMTGQFGDWTPIAVEQTSTGYQVAWKMTSADQYILWSTDSGGNFVSQSSIASGNSLDLQAIETQFAQDLNGDGTVGVVTTSIEANGWSSLTQEGNSYFLYNDATASMLKFGGAGVVAGQFAGWTPIAVEKTATGFDVAWKSAGNLYTVWATDNAGNYVSQLVGGVDANAMKAFEPTFHQDFSGDSTVAAITAVESLGNTTLQLINGNYFMGQTGGSMSTALLFGSGLVSAGQFAGWTAVGATQMDNGFQVAWAHSDGVQKLVWNVDSGGHFLSSTASMFGQSSALENFESSFQQDLNGDGMIGAPPANLFNITIDYGDGSASSWISYINAAVARWQQIIVGDVTNANGTSFGNIDDVKIKVQVAPIDGNNNVLAQGGPDFVRGSTTNIPYHGNVTLDSADVGRMASDGRLVYAIEHEIGHVLGFNTEVWDRMDLLDGNGNFIGSHALYAYKMLTGNQSATSVPMDGAHLPEATFGRELMTTTMTTAGDPISIVTLGILEDMGYRVNYSAADPYGLPALLAASLSGGSGDALHGGGSSEGLHELPGIHNDNTAEPVLRAPDWMLT